MGKRTCFISGLTLTWMWMTMNGTLADEQRNLRPDIQEHRLENGMTVFTLEDHSVPLVTYEVWFRVGSGEEFERPEGANHGITGLSHFFEHMMFRGTEKNPKFFDAVYALGGKLNAWTWVDSTVYWEKIPSQHLPTIIACEADRLENMDMSFLSLEPEREVVKSERLLRTENTAYGSMSELLESTAFRTHSYHWPTVGWMRDLNAITLEEARAHHATFYAPNNAYIVVVGDFDTQETLQHIQNAYGHLKARELPPSARVEEPEQQAERRDYLLKEVEGVQFQLGYKVPAVSHPDFAALEVLDQILNGGKSSRLKEALVHGEVPRTSALSSSLFPIRDPYLYFWNVKMLPGQSVEFALKTIDDAIENVQNKEVSPEELDTAVNRLQASVIREMLNNQQRADMIGFGLLTSGNPYLYFDRLEDYTKVTAADVQRVAKRYLTPERRTSVVALSPDRLLSAAAAWGTLAKEEEAGKMLSEALEVHQKSVDRKKRVADAEREKLAISLLQERAATALESARDAAEKAAIQSYMETSEKGDVNRTRIVEEELRGLRTEAGEMDARGGALVARVEQAISKAKGDKKAILQVALLYLSAYREAETTLPEAVSPAAAAFVSLWLDEAGRHDEAMTVRQAGLSGSSNESLDDPAEIRALLFDAQRFGVLPREETVGGR